MTRILTGIQSTNVPHLGNILGAILPALELSKKENTESNQSKTSLRAILPCAIAVESFGSLRISNFSARSRRECIAS